MGLESLMLFSTFFALGEDAPLYGNAEIMERTRIHQAVNDVGNSHIQSWLADPQPAPDLLATYDGGFSEMSDSQGVTSITKDSINYSNSRGPLGGLTGINWEEIRVLCQKHFKKVY